MMQDIVPTTENRQTDDWDIRKEHQGMYLGRCICAGGSWATIWSNTAYGDGGRAGMSEISMGIIEEEEDTAYHVFFDHSGPGSATRYASHQYKHIDMRSKCGTHREHTYQRRTGPENLVSIGASGAKMTALSK